MSEDKLGKVKLSTPADLVKVSTDSNAVVEPIAAETVPVSTDSNAVVESIAAETVPVLEPITANELTRVCKDGDLYNQYLDYVKLRQDLPIKAEYIKNPNNYKPIVWSIRGNPKDLAAAAAAAQESTTEDGTAIIAGSAVVDMKSSNTRIDDRDRNPEEGGQNVKRQKKDRGHRRGQNKDRNGNYDVIKEVTKKQICNALARHNVCVFGDDCKYSHAIKDMISSREYVKSFTIAKDSEDVLASMVEGPLTSDILSEKYFSIKADHAIQIVKKPLMEDIICMDHCVNNNKTYCPYGINCTMADHVDENGNNLCKNGEIVTEAIEAEAAKKDDELNNSSTEFKNELRKRNTAGGFPLTEYFMKSYKKECQFADYTVEAPITSEYSSTMSEVKEELRKIRLNIGLPERKVQSGDMFRNKLVLAPLTTVGNLPFRRLCTSLGADVTVSEMAVARSLLEGSKGEHALLKRHRDEKVFGIQLAGGWPDEMIKACEMLESNPEYQYDFVDINMGCPLEPLHKRFGGGSILMTRKAIQETMIQGMSNILTKPLSVKFRNAHYNKDGKEAHKLAPCFERWGASALIHHGRSAKVRYSGSADWSYVGQIASKVKIPVLGNGDLFSAVEANLPEVNDIVEKYKGGLMIGRGALIKPWIFNEIKENKIWDISASQRLDYYKQFCEYGLEHWGSDKKGVETTRRFFLESLSFSCRYIPLGILERLPAHIQGRPPIIQGRNELETLMASTCVNDWIKITEMILGPSPEGMAFLPKHKSNAYGDVQG